MSTKFRYFIILTGLLVVFGYIVLQPGVQKRLLSKQCLNGRGSWLLPSFPEITIATVICTTENNTLPTEEAIVMIKSAIISAFLYEVPRLTFHLFVELLDDADKIISEIQKFSKHLSKVCIDIKTHSAVAAVPEQYMIYDSRLRCGYVRIFLPKLLEDVDSILYLDTDTIVTGSIADIWSHLRNMTGEQLIGAVQNNEPDNPNWPEDYKKWFADIPHPPPKGINSGVLLMNLSAMKDYDWESKILRLFEDYHWLYTMNDQRLLNTYLRFDQGLLHAMPCQFNFKNTHCDYGLYCNGSESDPKGIQIVHGAAEQFRVNETFHEIYSIYKNLETITDVSSLTNILMIPIRERYSKDSIYKTEAGETGNMTVSKCFGTIDKLLFKNYFL